jgi:hypothetical protein
MEGSDYLLTCAEVGVALAGFSALVVAIRQRGSDPISAVNRRFVSVLIERGLMATFLSLLPILLWGLGASPSVLWLCSSMALAVYVASMAWRSAALRSDREAARLVPEPAFYGLMFAGLLLMVLQVAHAFGLGLAQSVWWYSVGITWLLASAGYLFFFVVRDWTRAA